MNDRDSSEKPLDYSDDLAPLGEPKLEVRQSGVLLLLPPPAVSLAIALLVLASISLTVFIAADVMILRKLPRAIRFVAAGRMHWIELVVYAIGLFGTFAMTALFGRGLISSIKELSRLPSRLEVADGQLVYTVRSFTGTRRREWPSSAITEVRATLAPGRTLGGKYAHQLRVGPLEIPFVSPDEGFGDRVATAFRLALGLPDQDRSTDVQS